MKKQRTTKLYRDQKWANEDGFPWSLDKPLREQWPWNGRSALEQVVHAIDQDQPVVVGGSMSSETQAEAWASATPEQTKTLPPVVITQHIAELPVHEPTPDWQDRVHEECDKIDEERLVETVAYCPPGSVRE